MKSLEFFVKFFEDLFLGGLVLTPTKIEIAIKKVGLLKVIAYLKRESFQFHNLSYSKNILSYTFQKRICYDESKEKKDIKKNNKSRDTSKQIKDKKDVNEKNKLEKNFETLILKILLKEKTLDSISQHFPKATQFEVEISNKYEINIFGNPVLEELHTKKNKKNEKHLQPDEHKTKKSVERNKHEQEKHQNKNQE